MKKEKKNCAVFMIAGTAILTTFQGITAQTVDTIKSQLLEEVVITATRSEQNPLKVGRSISILSAEKINEFAASNVSEALSQLEGIYIVGNNQNPGQIQNIYCRGANGNQTAILIDGMKISDPSSPDNAENLSELSLANIERIEIVRGSHSTFYGSSAIGGVINIITRANQSPGFHTNIDLNGGKFGYGTSVMSENLFMNYTDKIGYYINAEIYNTKVHGLDATIDTVTNPNDYIHNHRDRDNFNKTDLVVKYGFKNTVMDAFVSVKSINQKADLDKGAYSDDNNYKSDFKRNLLNYGVNYKLGSILDFGFTGGYTNLKRSVVDDSSIINSVGIYDHTFSSGNYSSNSLNDEIQVHALFKGFDVTAGAGLLNESMKFNTYYYSTAYGPYEITNNPDSILFSSSTISQFVHFDCSGSLIHESFKMFGLGIGCRNTRNKIFGNNFTYEINPTLKINDKGLLYCSFSTGFNSPTLYQLYSPDRDYNSGITRGNKTLQPETSSSLEFGFKQKVNDAFSFNICYFKTVVNKSIDYVYLWNKNKSIDSLGFADYMGDTYLNIGRQTSEGVEIAVSTKVSEKLWVNGNFSLVNGKLEYNPSDISNSHIQNSQVQMYSNGAFLNKEIVSYGLVRRPNTANLGLTYKPVKKMSFGINLNYVGPRSDVYYNSALGPFGALANRNIDGYTLVNLVLNYKINNQFSLGLKTDNVFDVKYYEIYGYTTRGRAIYLNLRYNM
jgi:vitamin B12 transporter